MLKKFEILTLKSDVITTENLIEHIEANIFETGDFTNFERQRVGYDKVNDVIDHNYIQSVSGDAILIRFKIGARKPDASTVKAKSRERTEELQAKGLKVNKKTVKEDVIASLLPATPPKFKSFLVMFDFKSKVMYSEGKGKELENLITKLKSAYPTSPFGRMLGPKYDQKTMTQWLSGEKELPSKFYIGDKVVLDNDGSKAAFTNVDLMETDAVTCFIDDGGGVVNLGLKYDKSWLFKLDTKGNITGLKPLSYVEERVTEYLADESDLIAELQTEMEIALSDYTDIIKIFKDYDDGVEEK